MTTTSDINIEALFDRLARTEEKAEIIDGEIVLKSPTGPWSGYAADEIYVSLRQYARQTKVGSACADSKIFRVNLPRRQSFSPDAAYFIGAKVPMKYYDGAPTFAVEVRSSGDYGPRAEREIAAKRGEYFAAGTLVVWEVDLLSADVVKAYRAGAPEKPTVYRPGDIAEAEPAVPGWKRPVNDLLPTDWVHPSAVEL